MKIQSKKSRSRKLLYLCIAGTILVGAGLAYAASTHMWPFPEASTSKSTGKTSSDSTDQNLTPDTSKDSTGTTDTPTNPKTPTQSTGGETATPTTPDTIGVTITHITPNGSYVMVGSNIEEITTSAPVLSW